MEIKSNQSLKIWQKKAPKIFMIGIIGLLSLGGISYGTSSSRKGKSNPKLYFTKEKKKSNGLISPKNREMLRKNGSNWDERSDFRGKKILTFKGDLSKCNAPIIISIQWGEIIYQNSAGKKVGVKDAILYKQGGEFWNWKPLKKEKKLEFSHRPGYQKKYIEYLLSKDDEVTHLILSTGWDDVVHFNGIKRDRLQKSDLNGVTPKGKNSPLILILNSREAVIAYNKLIEDDKNHVIAAIHSTC